MMRLYGNSGCEYDDGYYGEFEDDDEPLEFECSNCDHECTEEDCAWKKVWRYGKQVEVPACPECGEELDCGGHVDEQAAERRQMGICG